MLLILTNSADATADYLVGRLSAATIPFVRIDTDSILNRANFSYRVGSPSLLIGDRWHAPSDFSNVWYRRPERLIAAEGPASPERTLLVDEWTESLEGFMAHIPRVRWMNFPAANVLASRKLEQLTTATRLGFAVPRTVVTQDPEAAREFYRLNRGRVIAKPLGRAYVERPGEEADSLIFTNPITSNDLEDLSDLAACPTFFQQEIDKQSDVRITVVDGDVHAFSLVAKDAEGRQRCDIRRDNMRDVQYDRVTLPSEVRSSVVRLMSAYGLRFGAIDMAVAEDGTWFFFEINPNGQWAWLDLCGNGTIFESFLKSFAHPQRELP